MNSTKLKLAKANKTNDQARAFVVGLARIMGCNIYEYDHGTLNEELRVCWPNKKLGDAPYEFVQGHFDMYETVITINYFKRRGLDNFQIVKVLKLLKDIG